MSNFLFGYRSYLLQSYTPGELGMQLPSPDAMIERRQQYFHIFRIPFFPAGKEWMMRVKGQLLAIDADTKQRVSKPYIRHRGKWYSFTGIILLVLFVMLYLGKKEWKHYQQRQIRLSIIEKEKNRLLERLAEADEHDYFIFSLYPITEGVKIQVGSHGNIINLFSDAILKVHRLNDSSIVFRTAKVHGNELLGKIPSIFENEKAGDTVVLSKGLLQSHIRSEKNDTDFGLDLFHDGKLYSLFEIVRINGPVLSVSVHSDQYNIVFSINSDVSARFTKVTSREGNILWFKPEPQPATQFPRVWTEDPPNKTDTVLYFGYDWVPTNVMMLSGKQQNPGEYVVDIFVANVKGGDHCYRISGKDRRADVRQLY